MAQDPLLPTTAIILVALLSYAVFFVLLVSNKVAFSVRMALVATSVVSLLSFALARYLHLGAASVIVVASGVLNLVSIMRVAIRRDRRAVAFGEQLLHSAHAADIQLSYILGMIQQRQSPAALETAIDCALEFILAAIAASLTPSGEADLAITLLEARRGNLKVITSVGVPVGRRPLIERSLSYSRDHPRGIAALAILKQQSIYVPDLSDISTEESRHWVPVSRDEQRMGSLIAIPILSSASPPGVLAVLSVSSRHTISDATAPLSVVDQFEPKIAALLYLRRRFRNRRTPSNV